MRKTKKNYNIHCDCRGVGAGETIASILDYRGIDDPEHFFNPTQEDLLPLHRMRNIDQAAYLVEKAIADKQKIHVMFDTDTDGISAGAIMTRYLKRFTDNVDVSINDGKKHGLVEQDLSRFDDAELLIIVDSLDNTVQQYKALADNGVQIIVLDHHAIKNDISYDDYVCLVSSQRDYGNKALSGSGVTWKFCKYLDVILETDFADDFTDLAATGIIADMMDMTNMENRYIVSEGLKQIHNLAIKKIVGGFEFNSTAVAFSIAPLINAANRMNQNDIALKAFLTDDNKEALALVKQLKACKESQNQEVERIMPSAIEQCELQIDRKMMVVETNTKFGINGLIANKLLEKYQRPILCLNHFDGKYLGSMRAIGVEDFRAICNGSHLVQADGHELASGIFIKEDNMAAFQQYVEDNLVLDLKTDYDIDARIDVADINRDLIERVKAIDKVSGSGCKPLTFYIDGLENYIIGQMSDYKHLVVKPYDFLYIIKWNWQGSFEEMEDHSLMNEEIRAVGNLDCGFLGRKFVLKMICDDIEVVD